MNEYLLIIRDKRELYNELPIIIVTEYNYDDGYFELGYSINLSEVPKTRTKIV